mmetsp:Transcript_5392/g.7936  ORF Transcript_5392/g.7936 Transcript_5392/m.7936 type:complete len:89 (-) Transcript_5392:226-492(-)
MNGCFRTTSTSTARDLFFGDWRSSSVPGPDGCRTCGTFGRLLFFTAGIGLDWGFGRRVQNHNKITYPPLRLEVRVVPGNRAAGRRATY